MAKKPVVVEPVSVATLNSMANNLLDAVEKDFGMLSAELDKEEMLRASLTTGVLMYNLMYGGGVQPGWNVLWGGEGAGKTTSVELMAAQAANIDIPYKLYFDFEHALDPEKFENELHIVCPEFTHDKIFGVRSTVRNGGWVVPPIVRYYTPSVGEDFYLMVGQILRALPDKRTVDGKWYLVYPNTRVGLAGAKSTGVPHDKELYRRFKEFYVPSDSKLQAIIFLDSIQAMNPDAQETDEIKNPMAGNARMHAAHLPKVRSRLRSKHAAVVAIGQLRVNPGQRFGNPEYTSGGNALKHAADTRMKLTARSSPNGAGPVETEASVLAGGASDTYKYIHMKNEKNKFFTPHAEGWVRVWIDHEGLARGFDPVYDVFMYLCCTGRVIGRLGVDKGKVPSSLTINWPEAGLCMKKMSWLDFKCLVLYDVIAEFRAKDLKELCVDLGIKTPEGKPVNPALRRRAFAEMEDRKIFDVYQQIRAGAFVQNTSGAPKDELVDEDEIQLDDDI